MLCGLQEINKLSREQMSGRTRLFESLNQNNNYSIALIQQIQCPVQGKRYFFPCPMEGSPEFSFEIVSYFLSEFKITRVSQHLQQGERRKSGMGSLLGNIGKSPRVCLQAQHEASANTFHYYI